MWMRIFSDVGSDLDMERNRIGDGFK